MDKFLCGQVRALQVNPQPAQFFFGLGDKRLRLYAGEMLNEVVIERLPTGGHSLPPKAIALTDPLCRSRLGRRYQSISILWLEVR
jgi:hypothetical protein